MGNICKKSSTINTSTLWVEQESTSGTDYCNPVFDGKQNRIIIPQCYNDGCKGIEYYDCNDDKMKILSKYPKDIRTLYSICFFDSFNDIIYIYGGQYITFISYNIKLNKYEICIDDDNEFEINDYNIVNTGYGLSSTVVNNICHIIGGSKNINHYIFDMNNNINNNKLNFDCINTFHHLRWGISSSRIIYSNALNCCILMGGYCLYAYLDSIYMFNNSSSSLLLINGYLRTQKEKENIEVFKYCSQDVLKLISSYFGKIFQKWKLTQYKLPKKMSAFGAITFKQCIIIFGGCRDKYYYDNIYYCSIFDFKWKELDIKCPMKNKYYSILCNNKVHLFGYSTKSHHSICINSLIPN